MTPPPPPRKIIAVWMLEHTWPTEREAGQSLSLGTGAEALEPPPPNPPTHPKTLVKGSDLGLASGGTSASISSSSHCHNDAEGDTPLRASWLPPVVFTNTICIPRALVTAPEFLLSPCPLADPITTYPYIYKWIWVVRFSPRRLMESVASATLLFTMIPFQGSPYKTSRIALRRFFTLLESFSCSIFSFFLLNSVNQYCLIRDHWPSHHQRLHMGGTTVSCTPSDLCFLTFNLPTSSARGMSSTSEKLSLSCRYLLMILRKESPPSDSLLITLPRRNHVSSPSGLPESAWGISHSSALARLNCSPWTFTALSQTIFWSHSDREKEKKKKIISTTQ